MNNSDIVKKALTEWPDDTRSDDKKLMMAVWYIQDPEYDKHFKQFFKEKAMHPETIRRIRQKLQEDGQYKATKEVEEHRYKKFKEMRETAPRVSDPSQLPLV